jgi:hypothetical protein
VIARVPHDEAQGHHLARDDVPADREPARAAAGAVVRPAPGRRRVEPRPDELGGAEAGRDRPVDRPRRAAGGAVLADGEEPGVPVGRRTRPSCRRSRRRARSRTPRRPASPRRRSRPTRRRPCRSACPSRQLPVPAVPGGPPWQARVAPDAHSGGGVVAPPPPEQARSGSRYTSGGVEAGMVPPGWGERPLTPRSPARSARAGCRGGRGGVMGSALAAGISRGARGAQPAGRHAARTRGPATT